MKEIIKYLNEVNKNEQMNWSDEFIKKVSKSIIRKNGGFVEYGEDYTEIIDEIYGIHEDYSCLDFNDEIENIELVGEEELYDIEVSHDNLFYANDILTHNSSMGNMEAGMESISESLKIAMTADVAIMLISSDQMKEEKQQLWKFVKNRYTGNMASVVVGTNFERMCYSDLTKNYSEPSGGTPGMELGVINSGLDLGGLNFD